MRLRDALPDWMPRFFAVPEKRLLPGAAPRSLMRLRAEAKALGINVFQKGREQLRAEIAERKAA